MRVEINESFDGTIESPEMIAGWPGMGNVGLKAVAYMRADMGAKQFARIDMSDELMPEAIGVKDGLIMRPDLPETRLFYAADPSVIFVESDEQLHGSAALALMRGVLDLAREHGVRTIYTAAAFALPVSCAHDPVIYGAANDIMLRDRLGPMGVSLLQEGQISGMNGVLLGFANDYRIPAACLMATMPQYALRLPNPKSSREIIRFFERTLGCVVNMAGLNKGVDEMGKVMEDIERRILKTMAELGEEQEPGIQQDTAIRQKPEKKTPEGAMLRIEQLFAELAKEKSKEKAAKLKEELDRWNLYDLYEDRFLDLFKDGGNE
jgi:proteasome assembly chaperone (PAC2) family protein